MAQYVVPSTDILIFTDYHFCAGGITDGTAPAAALSQGATMLLRDVFFPAEHAAGAAPQPVATSVATRFTDLGADEAETVGASFAQDVPHLSLVSEPPSLSAVAIEDFVDSGTIELAGVTTFRSAGRLYSRTVGSFRVAFSVSSESLSGIVRADPTLQAIGMDDTGIHTILQPTHGSGCGACGVCGACVVCGEINYAVAGVAAFALVALQSETLRAVPEVAEDVAEPPVHSAGRIPREELTAAVRERVRPLLDLPDILAGRSPQQHDAP
jgi:hypothetical protein